MNLFIAGAEVGGEIVDVRLRSGRIAEIGAALTAVADEEWYDARGGALLPGLHDHHLHLFAMAAAGTSVDCGPPSVTTLEQLATALATAAGGHASARWLRGVNYHESVAGDLDRHNLDRLVATPLRIQHRSGAVWLLNSAGLRERGWLGTNGALPAEVEVDTDGEPTGRVWRGDHHWQTDSEFPDLSGVGRRLLSLGITGVTDASPDLSTAAMQRLAAAHRDGSLPQRVLALGAPDGWNATGIAPGPRKLLLHDHDLPPLDHLTASIAAGHHSGRPVAVHCVTRTSLVLTLAAFDVTGAIGGDRIEHAGVVPRDLLDSMRRLGLRVVTQPAFIADRGDHYRDSVAADDLECLYPYASLLAAGVPVAASSDAPFGDLDPWRVIRAAADRTTSGGHVLLGAERVTPARALAGYLSGATDPGGPAREVAEGGQAEVCLLSVPLDQALHDLTAEHIRLVIAGEARYDAV